MEEVKIKVKAEGKAEAMVIQMALQAIANNATKENISRIAELAKSEGFNKKFGENFNTLKAFL